MIRGRIGGRGITIRVATQNIPAAAESIENARLEIRSQINSDVINVNKFI